MISHWLRKRQAVAPLASDDPTQAGALRLNDVTTDAANAFELALVRCNDEWASFLPEAGDAGFYIGRELIGYAKVSVQENSTLLNTFLTLEEVNLLPDFRAHRLQWGTQCARLLSQHLVTLLNLASTHCQRVTIDMEAASRGGVKFCQDLAGDIENRAPQAVITTRVYYSPSEKPPPINANAV